MQTFIPMTSSLEANATVLDNKRLNKQALEGWQILMTLTKLNPDGSQRIVKGWANHPAVKMWQGHEVALHLYIQQMVAEWKRRGYKSTIGEKAAQTMQHAKANGFDIDTCVFPAWMENSEVYELVASSHRVALLNKDYAWYSQFGWPEDTGICPQTYTYVWPNTDGSYIIGEPRATLHKN